MKLHAHRAGLPEKEFSFVLCPLTPPTRRGLRYRLDPIYFNAGLMKPRMGLTLAAGGKKLGVGKGSRRVDKHRSSK